MLDNVIHIVNNCQWTVSALVLPLEAHRRSLSLYEARELSEAGPGDATGKNKMSRNYCFFYETNPIEAKLAENKWDMRHY